MNWRHRAVCRDEDPELWFPVGDSGPAQEQITEAKALCRTCPVSSECLAWALESGQDAGIWGGMTEDERRALKRRQPRPSHPAAEPEPSPKPAKAATGMSQADIARRAGQSRYGRARGGHRPTVHPANT